MRVRHLFWPLTLLAGVVMAMRGRATYKKWWEKERARLLTESHVVQTKLGPIEYQRFGKGSVVLIAHGTPGGYDQALACARVMANTNHDPDASYKKSYTYIAPSRPGYLRTPIESGRTPEEQADLFAALLDELGEEKATIVGISGGGPSAIQFALRHPQRCQGLIMLSGVAQHYDEDELKQEMSPFGRWYRGLYERLVIYDPMYYSLLRLLRLIPNGGTLRNLLSSCLFFDIRAIGYANDMEQFTRITTYPLAEIQAPTLVVHGTSDDEVPFEHAHAVAIQVPGASLFALQGGKHLAFYTRARQVMPRIQKFLNDTSVMRGTTSV